MLAASLLPARWRLSADVVTRGLFAVDWPGRWQRTSLGGRTLILDASHNPEGAQMLDAQLARLVVETGRRPVDHRRGALGILRAAPLTATVCRYAREVQLVVPAQARACGHEELAALIPSDFTGTVVRATVAGHCSRGRACARRAVPMSILVVTDSIYLLGEVLARLEPQPGAGEGQLRDFLIFVCPQAPHHAFPLLQQGSCAHVATRTMSLPPFPAS